MKSYIIKIELEDSEPLIWRRVVMPAGATYRRLHDVIQNVTNFQSGYPSNGYHLYVFHLSKVNMLVTDNEEAYLEHQHFVKNKRYYAERLKSLEPNMLKFEKIHQERLKIEIRKPTGLKIDDYLETYKEIRYNYDFGDNWCFSIRLEEIVEDYYFGYPTLLDGAETAPPEDIGGTHGFYEFLEAFRDPKHPNHNEVTESIELLYFKEYDSTWINMKLKWLDYKKTEWDKIKHENYRVLEDKYRGT